MQRPFPCHLYNRFCNSCEKELVTAYYYYYFRYNYHCFTAIYKSVSGCVFLRVMGSLDAYDRMYIYVYQALLFL